MHRTTLFMIWLAGVILPLVTIGSELALGWCAEILFDPLPSWGHVVAVFLVPLGNGLLVWAGGRPGWPSVFLAGVALGVAGVYALVFLPVVPLALFGLLLGVGLLALAPLLAAIAGLLAARAVHHSSASGGARVRSFWLGAAAGMATLVLLDLPKTVTRVTLAQAASSDPAESRRGLRWLRSLGDRELLLLACYRPDWPAPDLVGSILEWTGQRSVPPDEARTVYYRVTGAPFNSVPPPRERVRGGGFLPDWDDDQGRAAVGARLHDLSLASSRIDGSLDPEAALGYLEWTMEFRNDATGPQEARAQVQLPPGATVSRLTLWIAGEEREAAFGTRAATRAAYESVVRRNRDPLLVTTAGADHVQVQCFPVPPQGTMKIRLGLTVPLELDAPGRGRVSLPFLVERNFRIDSFLAHAVWLESKADLHASSAGLAVEPAPSGASAVRGALPDDALAGSAIHVARDASVVEAWAPDPRVEGRIVRQVVRSRPVERPTAIVLVVDGSQAMRRHVDAVRTALTSLPPGVGLSAIVAGDVAQELPATEGRATIAEALGRVSWQGGQDNVAALVRAWDVAARRPGTVIVWVHGPQPVLLQPAEALRQRWERRPGGPRLLALAVEPAAPNRVLESLDGLAGVSLWPTRRGLKPALEDLFARWRPGTLELAAQRSAGAADSARGARASEHLVRLWARDQIDGLLASAAPQPRKEAADLAVAYGLVSAVSGAVVLETAAQYAAAGLQPKGAAKVPIVPEPETWALLIVATLIILFTLRAPRGPAPASRRAA